MSLLPRHSVAFAEDAEHEDEDVDDVNVQLHGAIDVVLLGQLVSTAADDHLGVEDQELPKQRNVYLNTASQHH